MQEPVASSASTAFDKVNFWVAEGITGGTPAPANGQGFSMSADEMRTMLTKAKNTRKFIQEQFRPATRLAQAVSPADEPASNAAVLGTNGVNDTGRYYQGHLQIQYDHYSSLIAKLEAALGLTEESDQQAADAANQAGGEF